MSSDYDKIDAITIDARDRRRVWWRLLHIVMYLLLLVPVIGGAANLIDDLAFKDRLDVPGMVIDIVGMTLGSWGMAALFKRRLNDMHRPRYAAYLVTALHVASALLWSPKPYVGHERQLLLVGAARLAGTHRRSIPRRNANALEPSPLTAHRSGLYQRLME